MKQEAIALVLEQSRNKVCRVCAGLVWLLAQDDAGLDGDEAIQNRVGGGRAIGGANVRT